MLPSLQLHAGLDDPDGVGQKTDLSRHSTAGLILVRYAYSSCEAIQRQDFNDPNKICSQLASLMLLTDLQQATACLVSGKQVRPPRSLPLQQREDAEVPQVPVVPLSAISA